MDRTNHPDLSELQQLQDMLPRCLELAERLGLEITASYLSTAIAFCDEGNPGGREKRPHEPCSNPYVTSGSDSSIT